MCGGEPRISKTYEPHIIIWSSERNGGIKEFAYKEDAFEEYFKLEALHTPKVILAKVVRQHGEG